MSQRTRCETREVMSNSSVGIVVPTLGRRPEFFLECLESIRAAGDTFILVVTPDDADIHDAVERGLIDCRVTDPGTGLAQAINCGLTALPPNLEFVNWLGDDDRLTPGSLQVTSEILRSNPDAPYVFGGCNYIDSKGQILLTNHSGSWARFLMRIGPDLIPQPGSLLRRDSLIRIGGLDSSLGWAFDLDMFLRLEKIGKGKFTRKVLAEFRWHAGSLSVGERGGSAHESRVVRKNHLPSVLRGLSPLWEIPFGIAGQIAAKRLSKKEMR